jgi:hypothetical protein
MQHGAQRLRLAGAFHKDMLDKDDKKVHLSVHSRTQWQLRFTRFKKMVG